MSQHIFSYCLKNDSCMAGSHESTHILILSEEWLLHGWQSWVNTYYSIVWRMAPAWLAVMSQHIFSYCLKNNSCMAGSHESTHIILLSEEWLLHGWPSWVNTYSPIVWRRTPAWLAVMSQHIFSYCLKNDSCMAGSHESTHILLLSEEWLLHGRQSWVNTYSPIVWRMTPAWLAVMSQHIFSYCLKNDSCMEWHIMSQLWWMILNLIPHKDSCMAGSHESTHILLFFEATYYAGIISCTLWWMNINTYPTQVLNPEYVPFLR